MWKEGKQNLHGHERRRVERGSLKCTLGNDSRLAVLVLTKQRIRRTCAGRLQPRLPEAQLFHTGIGCGG